MSSAPSWPNPPEPRERISDALLDLCFERGYRATTVPMLLERAGVDRATFRRLFTDLENCFCEVYRELQVELTEIVVEAVVAEPTWRDRLRATAYSMADYVSEDERRAHFTVIDVRTAGDRAIYMMNQLYERLFDLIDEGRREPGVRDSVTRATAEAIGGTFFFQMFSSYEPGSADDARARVPELMYLAVLPYLGREAAEAELQMLPQRVAGR
jgi:AcrR family transcriptional regulator